jgi:hypothetical protein
MNYRKKFISNNALYDYKNIITYEILIDNNIKSSIEIKSTFTADFLYESKLYKIRPVTNFIAVRKFEILTNENIKLGEIKYWNWPWINPYIIIYSSAGNIVWKFDRKEPSFFRSRSSEYNTELNSDRETILYNFQIGNYFTPDTKNDCLREINGTIKCSGPNSLIGIIGIYLNELMIFDEMNK